MTFRVSTNKESTNQAVQRLDQGNGLPRVHRSLGEERNALEELSRLWRHLPLDSHPVPQQLLVTRNRTKAFGVRTCNHISSRPNWL